MSYITLTDANFDAEVLQSAVPVLVDFWAPWCGPCQMTGPIIEALSQELDAQKIKIAKLNVDESTDVVAKYNILSIPTFIVFQGGAVAGQTAGGMQKEQLLAFIRQYVSV